MKCVFLFVVVGLCVLYMNVPVMNARPNNELHKRSIGDDLKGARKHGSGNGDQAKVKPDSAEIAEENGEEDEGIDDPSKDNSDRKRRAATSPKYSKWTNPDGSLRTSICYKFKPASYGAHKDKKGVSLKQLMEKAADEWNVKAGLNLHYDQNGADCMTVFNDQGCWAYIGYQPNGNNMISLQDNACFTHGVILHEIGHSLGLSHEVKRADRDKFAKVNDKNIQKGAEAEFKLDPDENGISSTAYSRLFEYDYCSIMHYSATAFSAQGEDTIGIVSSDPNIAKNLLPCMGSQISLSVRDGEGVAKMYGTLEEDEEKIKVCKYDGYKLKGEHVKDPDRCRCSNLFEGNNCETPITDDKCGKSMFNLNADEQFGTLATPIDKSTNKYYTDTTCTWVVTSPKDTQVCIGFPNGYDVEAPATSGACAFDFFQVAEDDLLTLKTERRCGKSSDPLFICSESRFAALVDKSDDMYTERGFEGKVTFVDAALRGESAENAAKEKINSMKPDTMADSNANTVDNTNTVDNANTNEIDLGDGVYYGLTYY